MNNERLERYARIVRLDVIPTQGSSDASRPQKVVAQLPPAHPLISKFPTTNSHYVVMAQTCVCIRM